MINEIQITINHQNNCQKFVCKYYQISPKRQGRAQFHLIYSKFTAERFDSFECPRRFFIDKKQYNLMLKTYKSSLNLNSYKLDTRGFEEKLKQLTEQNAKLKFQLRESKSNKQKMYQQLKNSKLQVSTLRNMLKSQYVVHQNKCKNCAIYSKQSMDKLVNDLQIQKTKTGDYKKMYENQVENKKQITQYYQKKMHLLLRDKDILVKKYEQKIKYLSNQNISVSQSFDSSTSIQNHLFSTHKTQLQVTPQKPIESQRKKYPPLSPRITNTSKATPIPLMIQSQKQVISTSNDESINTLVKPIIVKLNKMQISFEELKTIPQIQRFVQTSNPPKTRFIKLLRDFPFQCEDDDLIEQSYKYIMQYLQYSRIQNSGENIINFLIHKMESN